MLSPLNANSEAFLTSLGEISQRLARAERQISTGLRFSSISDGPDQVSVLLQARAELDAATTTNANLGRVKSEVDTGEQALQSAVSIMERVRTLGSQGQSGTSDATARATIGGEVGSLLEQLGGLSRTTVEGRYIFSGDSDQSPPYTIDLTQATVISGYGGSPSTRQVQHPNGSRFTAGKTAQEIFDAPDATKNVFSSVNNLRIALLANDTGGIRANLENVIGSLTHLNGQLSSYGAIQNKVSDAAAFGSDLELRSKTQLSQLQDADSTQAILEFQQAQTQQQVTLQAQSKLPRSSLFDYLG